MLVLSRKAGEELIIADNIRIVVNRIAGNRVTIGIEAPGNVRIVRGELDPLAATEPHDADEAPESNEGHVGAASEFAAAGKPAMGTGRLPTLHMGGGLSNYMPRHAR